jgi:lipopolysaccharide export system permease protein
MRRSRYLTIYRYVTAEYLFSFFVAFLFFFFIFFVNHMILMAEEILSKSVPLGQVLKLIFFSLPSIVSFSFPFASLVGALMAVGRFSSDNEMLAMQASGFSLIRIFLPILFSGMMITGISFLFNDYFIPLSTIKFTQLYREVLFSNPALELEPYSIKYYQDSILITGNVTQDEIENILIIDRDSEKNRRIINADSARLERGSAQEGVISLTLDSVMTQTSPQKIRDEYEYSFSKEMVYNILLKDITLSMRNPGPREMSSRDVYAVIKEKREKLEQRIQIHREGQQQQEFQFLSRYRAQIEPSPVVSAELARLGLDLLKNREKEIQERSLQIYELEFHKKYSLPFACIVFVFFAFPVGLFTRRSGRTVGFGIGVLVSILYYGLLFAGQTLGFQIYLNPFWAMWLPNVIIFMAGITVFLGRLKR